MIDALKLRLLKELVFIPLVNGVLVDGLPERQELAGQAWVNLMPRLVPLLDGRRALPQLATLLPEYPVDHLRDALTTLMKLGMADPGDQECTTELQPALSFCRRFNGVTAVNNNGDEAYRRLAESRVDLIGCEEASLLPSLLRRSGIGSVRVRNRASLLEEIRSGTSAPNRIIVTLAGAGEETAWHAELDDTCRQHRLRWLRIAMSEQAVEIGPVFQPDDGCCYSCFSALTSFRQKELDSPSEADTSTTALWLSLAATEIIYFLSGLIPSSLERACVRYEGGGPQRRLLHALRLPQCARCGSQEDGPRPQSAGEMRVNTAAVYEAWIAVERRPVTARAYHQPGVGAAPNKRLRIGKEFSSSPLRLLNPQPLRLREGPMSLDPTGSPTGRQPLSLDALATMLLMTAGYRDKQAQQGTRRRWCASGGDIGSTELFVFAREVIGLDAGVYLYQPRTHSLAMWESRRGSVDLDSLLACSTALSQERLPGALIVFTSAYERLARKYNAFAYRLMHFDTGTASSQCTLVADALDVETKLLTSWADDLLSEASRLEPFIEQVTGGLALFSPASNDLPRRPASVENSRGAREPGTIGIGKLQGLSVDDILHTLYDQSRLSVNSFRERPANIGASFSPPPLPFESSTLLVESLPRRASLGETLAQRKSVRQYRNAPVPLSMVSSALHFAALADANDWPEDAAAKQPLEIFLLARNLDGVAPGAYVYDHSAPQLHRLSVTAPSDLPSGFFLQNEFDHAPLTFYLAGNLSAACDRHGAFGHRTLLLRAAACGNRLWLSLISMGLSGCLVGGMVAGEGRRRLHFNGTTRAGLLGVTCGYGQ